MSDTITLNILNAYLAKHIGKQGQGWSRVGAVGTTEHYMCTVGAAYLYVDFCTATNSVTHHFWD